MDKIKDAITFLTGTASENETAFFEKIKSKKVKSLKSKNEILEKFFKENKINYIQEYVFLYLLFFLGFLPLFCGLFAYIRLI